MFCCASFYRSYDDDTCTRASPCVVVSPLYAYWPNHRGLHSQDITVVKIHCLLQIRRLSIGLQLYEVEPRVLIEAFAGGAMCGCRRWHFLCRDEEECQSTRSRSVCKQIKATETRCIKRLTQESLAFVDKNLCNGVSSYEALLLHPKQQQVWKTP